MYEILFFKLKIIQAAVWDKTRIAPKFGRAKSYCKIKT